MDTINVKSIEFETAEKHRKGMATEDSALRLIGKVCKSLKIDYLQRILPPFGSEVGECDAMIFSDVGIFVVEVKRIGGEIKNLNNNKDRIRVEKGESVVSQENPINIVKDKAEHLSKYVRSHPSWEFLNKLFQYGGYTNGIPVYPVLCFGPSTSYDKNGNRDPNLIICNTRNMKKTLQDFIGARKNIIGAYRHLRLLSYDWKIIGKLTVRGKSGFIRSHPVRTVGKTTSFTDINNISGTKTGIFKFGYGDKVSKSTKELKSLVFRARVGREWVNIEVPAKTLFSWKAGG